MRRRLHGVALYLVKHCGWRSKPDQTLLASLGNEVAELGLNVSNEMVGAVLVELAEGGAGVLAHLALQLVVNQLFVR